MSPLPLILASASPRRKELLATLGFAFEVITADVTEYDAISTPHLSSSELAQKNAQLKAEAVAKIKPGRWVLGADTIVVLGNRILGKPASIDQARDYLRALSGHVHEVITGCALLAPDGTEDLFHEISRVTFVPLSEAAIDRYLAAVNVLDKAGAYALQQHGDWIIERVEGSRANVIGLPMETLGRMCKSRGLL